MLISASRSRRIRNGQAGVSQWRSGSSFCAEMHPESARRAVRPAAAHHGREEYSHADRFAVSSRKKKLVRIVLFEILRDFTKPSKTTNSSTSLQMLISAAIYGACFILKDHSAIQMLVSMLAAF